jgi:hypothetical protein
MNLVRKPFSVILLALMLSVSTAGQADASDEDRIHGVELEFDNHAIANADHAEYKGGAAVYQASDENIAWRDKWAKLMEKRCQKRGDCKVKEIWGEFSWDGYWTDGIYEYEVKYDNGFAFRISIDPAVLEVKIGPYTEAEYKKYKSLIDSEIFGTANELKLRVPDDAQCHVTTGAEGAFGGDVRKYRNYLALAANHPEAGLILNTSVENAPPLSYLPEVSKRNFKKVMASVDSGEITDEVELSEAMIAKVHNRTYDADFVTEWDPAEKFQEKNLKYMTKKKSHKRRFENRSMPAARNADDVLALIALNSADIEYAITRRGKVPVDIPPASLTEEEIVVRFEKWAKERGLEAKRYTHFYQEAYAEAAKRKAKFCKRNFTADAPKTLPKKTRAKRD